MPVMLLTYLILSNILPLHFQKKNPNAFLCPERSQWSASDLLTNLISSSLLLYSVCHYFFCLKCCYSKFLHWLASYHYPCLDSNVTFSERHFLKILINCHFLPLPVLARSCYNSEWELPQTPDLENHYLKTLILTFNPGSSVNSKGFCQCHQVTLFDQDGKECGWQRRPITTLDKTWPLSIPFYSFIVFVAITPIENSQLFICLLIYCGSALNTYQQEQRSDLLYSLLNFQWSTPIFVH